MNIKTTGKKHAVRMTWAILAAVSTTLLAGATQAAESGDAPATQVVSYADLNLNSTAGSERLYRRIQSAANKVCGVVDTRDLHAKVVTKTCIDRAILQAIADVDNPMLTSVHLAKTGKSGKPLLAGTQTH